MTGPKTVDPGFVKYNKLTVSSICAAFSPDGAKVATGGWNSQVAIWETSTGKLLQECIGHYEPVLSIAFSPDGKQCLTGSMDQRAILWDVK